MKNYLRVLLKRIFFCSSIFTVFFAHSAYRIIGASKEEREKMPPLYRYIVTSDANEEQVRNIIQTQGKDLDLTDGMGTDTALHLLIRQGGRKNLNLVREILNTLDVDVNKYDYTLLHEAASDSYPVAVIMLVDEFKANVNAVDNREKGIFTTPLHLSSFRGYIETMKALVERGADINATNKKGQIPLHIAAAHGDTSHEVKDVSTRKSMFRLLINNNINAQDKKGQTPLHLAAFYGMPNSVRALLALGADAQIKDIEGNTPYDVARARKNKTVKSILRPKKVVQTAYEITEGIKPSLLAKEDSWIKRSFSWCRNAFSKKK